MRVVAEAVSKRYRREWILKDMHFEMNPGEMWAVIGPNGAGKSTLLHLLSGHLSPSKGVLQFFQQEKQIEPGALYERVGMAAPYLELIEEFMLEEAIAFHARFKRLLPGLSAADLPELMQLPRSRRKEVRQFSSGMKQRLKLALAICFDTPLLLLDEPGTNLDREGIQWYHNLLETYQSDRLVVIASNQEEDLARCNKQLNIMDYKPQRGKQPFSR